MPFRLIWITDEKMSGKRFTRAQKTQQLAIQAVRVCPDFWLSSQCGKLRKTRRERSGRNQFRKVKKSPETLWFQDFCGSGWRIRTLTYRVRVCCATFTQTRYIRSLVSHEQVLLYRKTRICQGFFEKNNICRFQPFSGRFLWKIRTPRVSSEADLIIPQVRSGAESAFSLNFIRHQCPAPPLSPWFCIFRHGKDMDPDRDTLDLSSDQEAKTAPDRKSVV